MSIVLFILYVAIAVWVYTGLILRQMNRDVLSGAKATPAMARARRRFRRLLLAFTVASVLILITLLITILN